MHLASDAPNQRTTPSAICQWENQPCRRVAIMKKKRKQKCDLLIGGDARVCSGRRITRC